MKTITCICASESGFVRTMIKQEIPDSLVDKIILYEAGDLTEDNTIELFQALIDTQLAFQIKGSYERTAKQLIHAGLCKVA